MENWIDGFLFDLEKHALFDSECEGEGGERENVCVFKV
jgi:hypothetical protein